MHLVLAGNAGCGKDTCADMLLKFNYEKIALADSLREICSTAFNIKMNYFLDRDKKDKVFIEPLELTIDNIINLLHTFENYSGIELPSKFYIKSLNEHRLVLLTTPRKVLQYVGTDIFRKHFDDEIWIKLLLNKMSFLKNSIITDCRFKNERDRLRKNGGIIVLIKRPSLHTIDSHISEQDLGLDKEYDYVIYNTKDFQFLYSQLLDIIENEMDKKIEKLI